MNLETTALSTLSLHSSPPRASGGGAGAGANAAAARVLVDLTHHEEEDDVKKIAKKKDEERRRGRTERSFRRSMEGVTTISPLSDNETAPRGGDGGDSVSLSSPVLVPPLGGGGDGSTATQLGAAKQLRRLRELQDRRLRGMGHGRKRERQVLTGPSTTTSPARVDADHGRTGAGMTRRVSAALPQPTTLDAVKRQLMLLERKSREYAKKELDCLNKAKQLRDRREEWTRKYDKYSRLVATKDPKFVPAQLPPILHR